MARQGRNSNEALDRILGHSSDNTPDEAYVRKTYYITERQYRALKIKAAKSTDPKDKDLSAIVRAALDAYLADTLKEI